MESAGARALPVPRLARRPHSSRRVRWGDRGRDALAGLTSAIAAVPDGMAAGVLAGLNPLHGLYANIVGSALGGLTTSSVFMNVSTTGALAVAAGEQLRGRSGAAQLTALVTLTVLVGLFQLAMGLLRLGKLTRFVSNAVMLGFLSGIGVLVVLGQLPDVTGFSSDEEHRLLKTLDLLAHPAQLDPPTLLVAALTVALIVGLERTRLRALAMLIALVAAAAATALLGWESVALVGDSNRIPRALPTPLLPDPRLALQLALPAFGLAVIGLVQGAGVSHSYPNPGGAYPDSSRDFVGQGMANLGSGLLRGLPVGGSTGATALVVDAGARSRWANVLSGGFLAVAVLLLGHLVERLPLAALGGLLILAGVRIQRPAHALSVWRTGWVPRSLMLLTFCAVLAVPLQWAVLVGVAASVLLVLLRAPGRVTVRELVLVEDGVGVDERPAPAVLPPGRVVVLNVYGSLFFAGARALEDVLPDVGQAQRSVVVLLLRGREDVGSTLLGVLQRYARRLHAQQCRLMLVGVNRHVYGQLERTGLLEELGRRNVFPATARYGEAFLTARAAAETWVDRGAAAP